MASMQYVDNLCGTCGTEHDDSQNHEYEYKDTVDEELNCHICLSPIISPLDTACGHTFCKICITQTVSSIKMCPLDRKPTTVDQLREANFSFKRMLDKLKVKCPNCSAGMERGQLEGHLSGRCRSKRVRCSYGSCDWTGPENEFKTHVASCEHGYRNGPIKYGVETTIEFDVEENETLGISFVGGNETPLISIIVQEVFQVGAVRKDKRIKPGDVILKVNDSSLQDVQHIVAKNTLEGAKGAVKFTVYREQREDAKAAANLEIIRVTITKNRGVPLGLSIASKKKQQGVYIVSVEPNSVAARDRRLRPHDRIVEVNGQRVTQLSASRVSDMFKQNNRQVVITVAREKQERKESSASVFEDVVPAEPTYQPLRLAVIPRARAEKTAIIKKNSTSEKLGMSLAGGRGEKVNVPIYVSRISQDGSVGRSGMLNVGDIILAVNGKKLSDLSHKECLEKIQKANKDSKQVTFKVIEADDIDTTNISNTYHPSWLKWLALPPQIDNSTKVSLEKTKEGSFGFVIVGGSDSTHGPQPIFVQTIIHRGVAYKSKMLKCGDIIVKVNDSVLTRATHAEAIQVLRGIKTKAELTIKSWPGTVV